MNSRRYSPLDFDLVKDFLMESQYVGGVTEELLKQETAILCFSQPGQLIGFAMQWRNQLHDRTLMLELCVHPQERRKGFGTQLVNVLFKEFPVRERDFAIEMMFDSENFAAKKFSESLGMELYLKCYSNIFKIEEMNPVNSELEIIKLSDFYCDEKNKERIKIFHCSLYDRDHEPFIPLTKDKEVRYDYYNDGEVELGVVLLENSKIVGCSFAYLDIENELHVKEKGVTCLHGYAVGKDTYQEALRVQSLYGHQMSHLKERGLENIYIEFDSIEAISDIMLDWIPYTKKPTLRFQKRI